MKYVIIIINLNTPTVTFANNQQNNPNKRRALYLFGGCCHTTVNYTQNNIHIRHGMAASERAKDEEKKHIEKCQFVLTRLMNTSRPAGVPMNSISITYIFDELNRHCSDQRDSRHFVRANSRGGMSTQITPVSNTHTHTQDRTNHCEQFENLIRMQYNWFQGELFICRYVYVSHAAWRMHWAGMRHI